MTKQELEQRISSLKSFIEEEQRCLDYCINNPEECEDGEVEEREIDIAKLIKDLNTLITRLGLNTIK